MVCPFPWHPAAAYSLVQANKGDWEHILKFQAPAGKERPFDHGPVDPVGAVTIALQVHAATKGGDLHLHPVRLPWQKREWQPPTDIDEVNKLVRSSPDIKPPPRHGRAAPAISRAPGSGVGSKRQRGDDNAQASPSDTRAPAKRVPGPGLSSLLKKAGGGRGQ